jgi:biopolymer transport protein ExbB/TolQ
MDIIAPPVSDLPTRPRRTLAAVAQVLPVLSAVLGTALVIAGVRFFTPSGTWLHTFVLERGLAQPLTFALFFWGAGHVARRLLFQRIERQALRACCELLRSETLDRDRARVLMHALSRHAGTLGGDVLSSIISYFRTNRPTRDEVLKVANHAVDRAADKVDDEYAALAATLWLIPLSGFLGTVLGMSAAISAFDGVIAAPGGDLSALGPSVQGLAMAFDTTLLALALVVPLKIAEVGVHRRDRALLDAIDGTVGSGLVRDLDLAGLAQQTAEERALDRYAETVERIRTSLLRIDTLLGSLTSRISTVTQLESALSDLGQASRAVRDAVPVIRQDLAAMRQQSEQPMTLVRTGHRTVEGER